jgi:tetratricopeptide (TPR) repeat protein
MMDSTTGSSPSNLHGAARLEYRKGESIGGRFIVLDALGKGGCGVVYHVRNISDERELALKTFRDEYILDPDVRLQFRNEALTWIRIGKHSFVLEAEGVHEIDHRLYVSMEYIKPDENGLVTLLDHIAFHGRKLAHSTIGMWAGQFCHGMSHAYSKGIRAHRDVKPQNILVQSGVFIKISDFGLAASIEKSQLAFGQLQGMALTGFRLQGKTMCGTLGYIAPEIFAGAGANPLSDIYSFGVVLWQLCCGSTRPPFWEKLRQAPDPQTTYEVLARNPIPRVETPFWSIIQRCVQPRPSDRYQRFDEIREAIKEALRQSGDTPMDFIVNTTPSFRELVNRGASLRTLGQFDEALASYEAAIALEPTSPVVWVNKGNLLSSMKRRREALEAYARAAQLDPKFELAWLNAGLELQHSEDHAAAIRCFDHVLALNPQHARTWRRKGKSLEALGRRQAAKACYEAILQFNPDDDLASTHIGELCHNAGEHPEALGWYDRAIKANAKCTSAWTGKADVLIDLKRFEDAICCLDIALCLDPQDRASFNMKAVALCRAGRQSEAIPMFDVLLNEGSTDPDVVWTNKGNALAELGKLERALACFEQALKLNTNYAPARRQREWVMNALEQRSEGA